ASLCAWLTSMSISVSSLSIDEISLSRRLARSPEPPDGDADDAASDAEELRWDDDTAADQSSGMRIQPWRIAYTTAWVRSLTESFRRIELMWFLTVCSLIVRAYATCLLVMPWAMLSRISTSRGESGAKIGAASWPYTASSRNSLSTRVATAGFEKTLSLMRNSPSATLRMIVTRSSGPTSLRMNAAAPALIASNNESSSSLTARTMI